MFPNVCTPVESRHGTFIYPTKNPENALLNEIESVLYKGMPLNEAIIFQRFFEKLVLSDMCSVRRDNNGTEIQVSILLTSHPI